MCSKLKCRNASLKTIDDVTNLLHFEFVISNRCFSQYVHTSDGKEPGIVNNLRVKVVGLAEFFAKDENRINTDAVGVEIFDYLVLYDNYIDTVYVFYFK